MEYYLLNIKDNKLIKVDANNVFDKLYYLECKLPSKSIIEKNKKIFSLYATPDEELANIKINISKIEHNMPLYDAITENMYLIGKHDVYDRVIYKHFRFPEKELMDQIKEKKLKYDSKIGGITDVVKLKKIGKLNLMIEFMDNFDLDVLFNTYVKLFYKYSSLAGKGTTVCKNPSFLPQFYHIKPYLSRGEVINTALNFGIKISPDYIEQNEINKLCKIISKYQLHSSTLLEHQYHILNSGSLGRVQYYTLQGSYFMNQYLRNMTSYDAKNVYLESLIEPMWKLVLTAPKFDKSYIFYRFIKDDNHLRNLNLGDIFTEKGFMSTTRDPFYRSDLYKFGFILIKVKIPANIIGVALCLETISHFAEEQEIIFPPNSKFKLISRDDKCLYYHTDPHFSSKVKTRYEFEWIENEEIKFERTQVYKNNKPNVDFLQIKGINSITLSERLRYFDSTYVNDMYQFNIEINGLLIPVLTEWYDSTGAYADFYALNTNNGYSMYSMYNGYILFFVELGENDDGKQMHVNYYVRYSSIDPNEIIGSENLIKMFSSIAYYFDISNVVIYANYMNCEINTKKSDQSGGAKQRGFASKEIKESNDIIKYDEDKFEAMGGNYCTDIYQYLTTGTKKYSDINILNVELQPIFSYHDLKFLNSTSPDKILLKDDRDEIYQIYDKQYKTLKKDDTIGSFYVWLIEQNKCYLLDMFVIKIDRILGKNNNPFRYSMYTLDPFTYLYNRKYIKHYPVTTTINKSIMRSLLKENKNEYRKETR